MPNKNTTDYWLFTSIYRQNKFFGKDMIESIKNFEKFICNEQDGKVMLCLLQRNS